MKKKIIIIASIIIAIIIGLLLYFLVFKGKDKDNKPKPTNSEAETITIKFDVDGGEEVDDIKIKKGTSTTLPTTTKDGFTLEGWYLDDEKINDEYKFKKDTTLKAKWEEVKEDEKVMKITFDSKGGSKVNGVEIKCKDDSATINSLPKPTKDGYTFRAWEDKNGKAILLGAKLTCDDITLYAGYDKKEEAPTPTPDPKKPETKTVKITFDSKGGSKVNNVELNCSDNSVTINNLPKTTKDGYNFVAWTDKWGTPILEGAKLTCEDLTLYADWKEKVTLYSCPDGYDIDANHKCVSKKSPEYYCTDGYKNSTKDNTVCYKYAGEPTDTHTCKPYSGYETGTYFYVNPGKNGCVYQNLDSYPTQQTCKEHGGLYDTDFPGNHCWKYAVTGSTYVETKHNCYNQTYYRTAADLGGTISNGCYSLKQRQYGCKNAGEGYSMNYTTGKCVKTIDATVTVE